ncbi:3'-5' exonuclease [Nannocystis pusilla]|uniref:3'-5' exonuclease n=1 Tax=Nannocystis pusilla TaxID=889268 RepID=UPI003DA5382A
MPAAFDRVVVLDFEATCDSSNPPSPQEVIEFPSVLVSLREREVVDSFSTFVRPVHHPTLSAFCTELTTIRQQDVDAAPVFANVLAAHRAWLEGHGLFDSHGHERFALVTCGDWDLQTMLPVQCAASGIPIGSLPRAYRRWINIKKIFLERPEEGQDHRHAGDAAGARPRAAGHPPPRHRRLSQHRPDRPRPGRPRRPLRADRQARRLPLPRAPAGAAVGRPSRSRFLKKRHLASLLGLASGVFRTKIVRATGPDGAAIEDDDPLAELPPESRLRVFSARDPVT